MLRTETLDRNEGPAGRTGRTAFDWWIQDAHCFETLSSS